MESAEKRTSSTDFRQEAGLIAAAQGGDAKAFGQLVRLHQRPIWRVAYGLTRNASDADDLTQETFVRAWQALGRFRVGEPMHPWLARIAVNLAFSLFRTRRRRPEVPIEPLIEAGQQFAGTDDPAREAVDRDHGRHLAEAFGELSEEHRVVLVLRVVDQLTYDEIAHTLNVPAGTVMSRLSRARSDLRARLAARTGEAS